MYIEEHNKPVDMPGFRNFWHTLGISAPLFFIAVYVKCSWIMVGLLGCLGVLAAKTGLTPRLWPSGWESESQFFYSLAAAVQGATIFGKINDVISYIPTCTPNQPNILGALANIGFGIKPADIQVAVAAVSTPAESLPSPFPCTPLALYQIFTCT